jgi:GNAT superfamily N-acetyltransferase
VDEPTLNGDGRLWGIYAESFPVSEHEPKDVIMNSVRLGSGMAFRAVQDGRTVAMATTHILRSIPAMFLVYLAVDPDLRGAGAGGRLLEFINGSKAVHGNRGLVWETDRVEDADTDGDRSARERRLRFFQHHGGKVVCGTYHQPALDGIAPAPMNILFRASADGLEPQSVRSLIHSIYFENHRPCPQLHQSRGARDQSSSGPQDRKKPVP